MSSTNEHLLQHQHQHQKPKLSPLEFRNTDLVSRLLAATPPYLYNMSLLPNTYFFSEMLRSLVQAKNEQNARIVNNNQIHHGRRSRKRTWTNRIDINSTENKTVVNVGNTNEPWMIKSNKKIEENPLELTNKNEEIFQENNANNLVLPPPPPMWYPPIYPHPPPYGIDPLHFFIDLRVSGHIYDRKKENNDGNQSTIVTPKKDDEMTTLGTLETKNESIDNIFGKRRHCSAFSVPQSSKNCESKTKFDVKSMGFDKNENKTSTNYIMNNITSIYKNLGDNVSSSNEDVNKKEEKDLKTLVGLELIVDYDKKSNNEDSLNDTSSSEVESVGSPNLEVVDIPDENNI